MSVKKITSLLIVMLFISTALILVLPESDSSAEDERTAVYIPEVNYYRTNYTSIYWGGEIFSNFYAKSTEVDKKDVEFQNFIDGKGDYVNSDLEYGDQYYTYEQGRGYGCKQFHHDEEKTLIPLNRGDYTVKINEITGASEKVILYMYRYGYNPERMPNLTSGSVMNIHATCFTQIYFGCDYGLTAGGITVKYSIDPSPATVVDKIVTENEKTIDTVYYWTRDYITLPEGNYNNITLPSSGIYSQMFKKDSADENKFIEEIISTNKVYRNTSDLGSPDNLYNSIRWSWGHTDNHLNAGEYVLYSLVGLSNNRATMNYNIEGDSEYHSVELQLKKISEKDTNSVSMYTNSFDTFKIAVSYDKDLYQMYLKFSGKTGTDVYVPIESDKLYSIYNEEPRIYEFVADYIGADGGDISMNFFLYTENIPSPDSNTPIFAVLCVIICAIVFGLLFLSGRKPSWSKDPKKP